MIVITHQAARDQKNHIKVHPKIFFHLFILSSLAEPRVINAQEYAIDQIDNTQIRVNIFHTNDSKNDLNHQLHHTWAFPLTTSTEYSGLQPDKNSHIVVPELGLDGSGSTYVQPHAAQITVLAQMKMIAITVIIFIMKFMK